MHEVTNIMVNHVKGMSSICILLKAQNATSLSEEKTFLWFLALQILLKRQDFT